MKPKHIVLLLLFIIVTVDVHADGIIVPEPTPDISNPRLSVKYHHVNVSIQNQVARTAVDQVFENPYQRDLEGDYLFPLPEGASISKFSMYAEGEEIKGELMDKEKARGIYESIVRRKKDPALLEYVDRNTFRAKVYPIPAEDEKRINIKYSQMLECDSGLCHYEYPLEIEKHSSKPLESTVISVKLESEKSLKSIYSPTHDISIKRKDNTTARISFEAEDSRPEKDFELYYSTSAENFGANLMTQEGFYSLLIAPDYNQNQRIIPKDIVFVIDTSGSMSGDKIKQAKEALKFCARNLNEKDRFNLIAYDTEIKKLSRDMLSVDSENITKAMDFIEGLNANGGTNINDALQKALSDMQKETDRPQTIIFLTDGKPTVGVRDSNEILSNTKEYNKAGARMFVFGIGYDVNTHLLDLLSENQDGVSQYVEPEENIEVKVSDFYKKIKNPVLSNLSIEYEGMEVSESYPRDLPDLFKGSQLVIYGKYNDLQDPSITLKGLVNGKRKEFTYDLGVDAGDKHEFIPRLWATRKIGYLLDQIRLHGEEQELVDEIVNLSLKYGVMTPYTSFLVDLEADGLEEAQKEARKAVTTTTAPLMTQDSSGKQAIGAAKNTQKMKESVTYSSDSTKVETMGSKTFFQRQGIWIDNDYENDTVTQVEYDSQRYYDLLSQNPDAGKYLSLGKEIKFCLQDECYHVTEDNVSETTSTTETTHSTDTTQVDFDPNIRDVFEYTFIVLSVAFILAAFVFVGIKRI